MTKLVINAQSAHLGGGITYLINLLEKTKNFQVVLLVNNNNIDKFTIFEKFENIEFHKSRFAGKSLVHRSLWENFYLPFYLKTSKADLLYSVSGILPKFYIPRTCKTAVICQNMIPFCPEELNRFDSFFTRLKFHIIKFSQIISFKKANLVIFISEFAYTTIAQKILKNKVKSSTIIPHGLPDIFIPKKVTDLKNPHQFEYVIYVSSMFEYKAQLELIDAWILLKKMRETNEKLILIGHNETSYGNKVKAKIKANNLEDEILLKGHIEYTKLPHYYQNAKLNIFSSSCENCPNILLEALASGAATLCSNFSPMPEFAENAVQYFNPYNITETAEKIATLLENKKQREELSFKALDISKKYKWTTARDKTFQAFQEIIEV